MTLLGRISSGKGWSMGGGSHWILVGTNTGGSTATGTEKIIQ